MLGQDGSLCHLQLWYGKLGAQGARGQSLTWPTFLTLLTAKRQHCENHQGCYKHIYLFSHTPCRIVLCGEWNVKCKQHLSLRNKLQSLGNPGWWRGRKPLAHQTAYVAWVINCLLLCWVNWTLRAAYYCSITYSILIDTCSMDKLSIWLFQLREKKVHHSDVSKRNAGFHRGRCRMESGKRPRPEL